LILYALVELGNGFLVAFFPIEWFGSSSQAEGFTLSMNQPLDSINFVCDVTLVWHPRILNASASQKFTTMAVSTIKGASEELFDSPEELFDSPSKKFFM